MYILRHPRSDHSHIACKFQVTQGQYCRHLCYKPCQISLHEPSTSTAYLVYTEDCSKTNQGGLLHCDHVNKKITMKPVLNAAW